MSGGPRKPACYECQHDFHYTGVIPVKRQGVMMHMGERFCLGGEEDTQLVLSSAYADQESDSLWFSYASDDPPGPFYLSYNIEPVQAYSAVKGGTAV